MGVDGLPGDEQPHDLAGALEDPVDAEVAQHLLGRYRSFPPVGQGLGGLVAAAAADLDQLVGDQPGHLAGVQLGQGGLDPDVLAPSSAIRPDSSSTASSPNAVAAMNATFWATASCRPIGRPHWTRSRDHSRAIRSAYLAPPAHIAGRASRPVFSVVRAILRPVAFPPEAVGGRDPDPFEAGHTVLDAAQTHELVAVLHRHAGCVGVDDEARDATAMTVRRAGRPP